MKKSKQQKPAKNQAGNNPGLKHALTVAAAVASLGTSLGVDVEKTFAAAVDHNRPAGQTQVAFQEKQDAFDHKLPASQYKETSIQHKGESTQHKFENQDAHFIKLHNKKLINGNTFILIGNKPFIRTQGGAQTPAADGIYEFQDGKKITLKGGQIVN